MPNIAAPSRKPLQQIQVVPSKVDQKVYLVSLVKAEQMVARGHAKWIPGLKRLHECRVVARGEMREWRKVMCYDPDGGFAIPTMQLVPPRSQHTSHSTVNNKSNRKRRIKSR